MWSSLEKFAYPDWFYPLVVEKPFLTFGMPRDVFIPMGRRRRVHDGFGLLWTPLVRRLSAIALFFIFNAAVYPFGRIDIIGHALIMAIIVAIAADHTRQVHFLPAIKRSLAGVPAGIAAALLAFGVGYWGLHTAFYGPEGRTGKPDGEIATHSHSPEHPHGPQAPGGIGAPPARLSASTQPGMHSGNGGTAANGTVAPATAALTEAMDRMHRLMMDAIRNPDPDVAFVTGMIPHHQGAIDMARIQIRYGSDPHNRELAQSIIDTQSKEITHMQAWLRQRSMPGQ